MTISLLSAHHGRYPTSGRTAMSTGPLPALTCTTPPRAASSPMAPRGRPSGQHHSRRGQHHRHAGREGAGARVRRRTPAPAALNSLKDAHHCVKDVRGTGFFYAIEFMADSRSGRELSETESLRILREVLPDAFRRTKVLLRGDDRGATMLMIAPPLVSNQDVLSELLHGIDAMLTDIEKAIQR
jgi:hypothetical protein